MNAKIKTLYREFRDAGYNPSDALSCARTVAEFSDLERKGFVTVDVEYEDENYWDVYGEPEGYVNIYGRHVSADEERAEIEHLIDVWGLTYVMARYRTDPDEEWQDADSVGMCLYERPGDPLQNCYVPDLMRSAISALQAEMECEDVRRIESADYPV